MTTIQTKQIDLSLSERGVNPDDGVIYMSGDPLNPKDNDWRLRREGVFTCHERYDSSLLPGDPWTDQLQEGGSIVLPDGVTIVKGSYAGELLVSDSTGLLIAMSAGIFERTFLYGDFNGNPSIIGNTDVFKAIKTRGNLQSDIQPGNSNNVAATEFSTYVFPTFIDASLGSTFFQTNFLKFQPVGIPADNKVRILVFESPNFDEGDQIWQNISKEELGSGEGSTIDPTTGEVPITPGFRGPGGKELKIVIQSAEPITLKCNDALGDDVTISSIDEEGKQDSIVAHPPWRDDIIYAIGDLIFQGDVLHIGNTPGMQATDFATNIALWDKPLSKEEMYRARISAYLTTNLTLDGTEQILAFDAEKWSRDITCTAGVFTVATKGYYQGFVSLYLLTTGVATIIVWVECKHSGGSWMLIDGSMIRFTGNDDVSGYVPMNGGFDLLAGDEVRVKIKKISGTASLQSASESVALGTISQPAASISFVRSDNVIPVP